MQLGLSRSAEKNNYLVLVGFFQYLDTLVDHPTGIFRKKVWVFIKL